MLWQAEESFRQQYNALGKRNLAAIEQIVTLKYRRGAAFNRQHPFDCPTLQKVAIRPPPSFGLRRPWPAPPD
jgi:hypothetical protein